MKGKPMSEPKPKSHQTTSQPEPEPPRGSPYSINEPEAPVREHVLHPVSINEPPTAQEKPSITLLSPDNCMIGDPDFILYVTGTGFSENSMIVFAGHDEPTTRNEDGTLSTGVQPSLWDEPVVVQCAVRNGAQVSNALDFDFGPATVVTEKRDHKLHRPSPPYRR